MNATSNGSSQVELFKAELLGRDAAPSGPIKSMAEQYVDAINRSLAEVSPPQSPAGPVLPECRFRGDSLTITAPGSGATRTAYECDQPHIRGRDLEPAKVSPAACMECGYSDAAFTAGAALPGTQAVPQAEYQRRYAICSGCGFRSANFCLRAAGDCSLTQKLGKGDFDCPEKKF